MARRSGHGHGKTTIAIAQQKYINAIQFALQQGNYAKGVSAFLGAPVNPAAPPVQHWNMFAQNVQVYAQKWANDYRLAYTGGGYTVTTVGASSS